MMIPYISVYSTMIHRTVYLTIYSMMIPYFTVYSMMIHPTVYLSIYLMMIPDRSTLRFAKPFDFRVD